MSFLIAALGMRGAVVAMVLSSLLLAASGLAGWQWFRAEAAVLSAGRAAVALKDAQADTDLCLGANASIAAADKARRDVAAVNAKAYEAAITRAKDAAEKARKERAQSDARLAAWERLYGSRTPTCAAALTALDSACPELEKY